MTILLLQYDVEVRCYNLFKRFHEKLLDQGLDEEDLDEEYVVPANLNREVCDFTLSTDFVGMLITIVDS